MCIWKFSDPGGGDYFFSNLKFINLLKIGKKKTTKNLHIKKRKVRCLFFTNKILPGGGVNEAEGNSKRTIILFSSRDKDTI